MRVTWETRFRDGTYNQHLVCECGFETPRYFDGFASIIMKPIPDLSRYIDTKPPLNENGYSENKQNTNK